MGDLWQLSPRTDGKRTALAAGVLWPQRTSSARRRGSVSDLSWHPTQLGCNFERDSEVVGPVAVKEGTKEEALRPLSLRLWDRDAAPRRGIHRRVKITAARIANAPLIAQ